MRLMILSNREPLQKHDGRWSVSVGGLTAALVPVLEQRGGVWIAWGEQDAGEVPVLRFPEHEPTFEVRRLELTDEEVSNYYYGLANRVLWPLCHYFIEQMDLQRQFYRDYCQVNWRFAQLAAEAYEEGDLAWVQDYQLMLVPGLLRKARPAARVGYFHHIPWPAVEVWRTLPWATDLLEGLLGADLIGFHDDTYVRHFLDAARELAGAEVHGHLLHWNGREIRVEAFPIGIDTARFTSLAKEPEVRSEAERIRSDAGSDYVVIGVDRLDYTKGVLERLLAFEQFLADNADYQGRVSFYQIASPSRTRVDSYQDLKRSVDEVAGRINGMHMRDNWVPVRYLYRSLPQEELIAFYLAADAALITPLRDGMNVVAQEFALTTERGMLVLSNLTGAAQVLDRALLVNPYDIEGVARTLRLVLDMADAERQDRMAPVKDKVLKLDVHLWADRFLNTLSHGEKVTPI